MAEDIERTIIRLIATDRISIPIQSMGGKLYRRRPKIASGIDLEPFKGRFVGERVYARLEPEDSLKARGVNDGIERFKTEHPKHGEVLMQYIEEERSVREDHLYFGVNEGCRLTADDYIDVMMDLGFTEATARRLYPELMEISRKMSKKRDGAERSVLVG